MTKREKSQLVADLLQDAFESDPEAMLGLMRHRVPCNEELADHPDVVVARDEPLDVITGTENFTVGVLGLINGVLGSLDLLPIASKWSDGPAYDSPAPCQELKGFCVVEEQKDSDE